jgi:hypothetical protein
VVTHRMAINNRWLDGYLDDDRILIDIVTDAFIRATGTSAEELQMSADISDRVMELGHESKNRTVSYDELYGEINRIAESYGCEYGIPLPCPGEMRQNFPVMARGVPMREILYANQALLEAQERNVRMGRSPQEAAMELLDSGCLVVNSWYVVGDQTVCVIATDRGPMALPRYGAVQRSAKLLRTLGTRMDSQMTVEAEMKARDALRSRINESQWRCYVLNDCFLERSERSDLHYLFRKGYPTLVFSYHGDNEGRVIAALCLHPIGYYQYTHAGLMTPTDEVICHLLLMRADEHKFWAKSGQWRVTDTRSGV